jgi:DNA-binding transcriptional LysR family regulator
MDTLLSIKVFRHVVETGSFVRAAERLDLSTAMASKHVMHLEDHLGTRLLNRTTRKLSLTEPGREYYARCAQILNDLDEAQQAIGDATASPRGTLRINALLAFGIRHVAPAISKYSARFPQVTVDLTLNDRVVDLVEEGYDLAIRASASEIRPATLVARRITSVHLVACATPEYLARHGTPRTPEALQKHNCLLSNYSQASREWTFNGPNGPLRVPVSGNFIVNNGDALRAATLAGNGIALVTTDIVGDDLAARRLVPLFTDYAPTELKVYAAYPSNRHVSAKVRTFVDFLVDYFADHPFWGPEAPGANARRSGRKRKASA